MSYKKRRLFVFTMAAFLLCGCASRTTTTVNTVLDVGFWFLNAGNYLLTEWGEKPDDYEEYKGTYVSSYRYEFKHDGTAYFDAVYLFEAEAGEGRYEEHEIGVYKASGIGPNKTISVSLPSRNTALTWEPNPRDPTGELVFRMWEKRIMSFGKTSAEHEAKANITVYLMFYSEYISPRPL